MLKWSKRLLISILQRLFHHHLGRPDGPPLAIELDAVSTGRETGAVEVDTHLEVLVLVIDRTHGRIRHPLALELERRRGVGGEQITVGRRDAHVDGLLAGAGQVVGGQDEIDAQTRRVLDTRNGLATVVERREPDVAGPDDRPGAHLVVELGGLLLGHVGAEVGGRNLLAERNILLDKLLVERIERIYLLDITAHDGPQGPDLLLVLLDFGQAPRTLLLEPPHQRIGALALETETGGNGVVRNPEVVEIGHQTPEIVLNRIALDLQQLVVEHLLTVDAEVECG